MQEPRQRAIQILRTNRSDHEETSMQRLAVLIGMFALALALGAGACSGGSSSDNGDSGDSATFALSYEVNFKYDPVTLSVPANQEVTLSIKNNDPSLVHNFVIPELEIDSGEADPNSTQTVKFTAVAGTYTYICNIAGHQESGMVGTLTVS